MPIAREDGFYQTHDLSHVTCLGVESDRLAACIDHAKCERVKGLFGSPSFGFVERNLDFVSEVPWLETIWFWDVNLENIDGLYTLLDLRHFGVHPRRPGIDFSRFGNLQTVVLEPQRGDRGLASLTAVQRLDLWHYRSKDGSFDVLEFPKSLVELQINWVNVTSLDSLPALEHLERLEVHRSRNLTSLGDVGVKFPRLRHLVVNTCGRVSRQEGERVVRDLPQLQHAFIQKWLLV